MGASSPERGCRSFPSLPLRTPSGAPDPDESQPGVTGTKDTGQVKRPRDWLLCARAVDRRRAPSSGARRARLFASRRAHSSWGSGGPAGTRRCPWCCRRRAGRGRGEGGSQWRGCCAGRRGPRAGRGAHSAARGTPGARTLKQRLRLQLRPGSARAATVVPLARFGSDSGPGSLGAARPDPRLGARGPCAGHPTGNPAGPRARKDQAPGPGPLLAARPAVRTLPRALASREPAGPWSAHRPTGR